MAAQPNILYIHSHDTGRYVQPYGYAVPAPHYQQLAQQGVVFRQAFCAAPTCSPSRAALLTGMAPHSNGMMGLAHLGFSLNDYGQHIVHTLRRVGYYSALAGVQHIDAPHDGLPARRIGYDALLTEDPQRAGDNSPAGRAVEFLQNAPKQPFFLSVGFSDTHREYPPEEFSPNWVRPPAPIPDTPETRVDMARYITSAARLDAQMGRVLAALDETGLAENTLVVCTTDHGLAFPGMKCTLTDHGTGVLLILRGPGACSGGRVIDALVSQIDLFPTLCEFAGADIPEWVQGRSLLPLIEGKASAVHDAVYSEVTYHAAYEPMRAIRTQRYKYIRRFSPRNAPVLPNCDDSPAKTLWLQNGWRAMPPADEQLYDLIFDPNEAHNLANSPEYAAVQDSLAKQLHQWMTETQDPLLLSDIPIPDDYPILQPDQSSPSELALDKRLRRG